MAPGSEPDDDLMLTAFNIFTEKQNKKKQPLLGALTTDQISV